MGESPMAEQPAELYTDPNELFDVYDGAGRATGRVKRRQDVHRDGDWHRSFHCWVTCETGGPPSLLIQRRGAEKDTWPGKLDVTVGGHFRAGETLADVVREVEEEIGQAVELDQLVSLGRHVYVGEQAPGTLDRELQDVYLWRSPLPLEAYRPRPVEVAALEAVAVADLLALFAGSRERVPCRRVVPHAPLRGDFSLRGVGHIEWDKGSERLAWGEITCDDFIPTLDRYYYRVATVADLALRGYPHLVV